MNNVLQALIDLFKNVGTSHSVQLDQKTLVAKLDQFGVSLADLEKTLANMAVWAAAQVQSSTTSFQSPQVQLSNYLVQPHKGVRVFTTGECAKLNKKARGFLTQLQTMGILDAQTREQIIDQLMQINVDDKIPFSHIKWVAFQALFHDAPPDHLAYLEWLLFGKVMDAH